MDAIGQRVGFIVSVDNLRAMLRRADAVDMAEARLAYRRYNMLMVDLAEHYGVALNRVVAAFVSLSPNNDYLGNLRSLVSVLEAVKFNRPREAVTVSTYGHCGDRAFAYATGAADFIERTGGLKILSFYHNVLDPSDRRWVTVDGHMVAAWRGNDSLTMKDAIPRRLEYLEIRDTVRRMAAGRGLVPNQLQAAIWFAHKRSLGVKYPAQLSIFHAPDDHWRTVYDVRDLLPFKPARVSSNANRPNL